MNERKLDILALGAHPDDIELSCAGTLVRAIGQGKKVGIVDLTQGELGTRGSAQLRLQEAARAQEILGIHARENLGMKDGFFSHDEAHLRQVIVPIRKYQPDIVLCNAVTDRHPDHGRGAKLVSEACFLAGLPKIETEYEGKSQKAWRPKAVYHYIQDRFLKPDFVVDITDQWEVKRQSIMAYSSQFYNPDSTEPDTPIATPEFLDFLEGRASQFGRSISVKYAEGFTVERTPGVDDLFDLI